MSAAYDPNKQGWGFASVVVLLAGGLLFTAYSIHSRTYLHPRDPMSTQVFRDRDASRANERGASAEPEAKGSAEAKPEAASETKPAH